MKWMMHRNDPSNAMKKLYEKNMAGTYGAFTYGNSRFIALDSENKFQSNPLRNRSDRQE